MIPNANIDPFPTLSGLRVTFAGCLRHAESRLRESIKIEHLVYCFSVKDEISYRIIFHTHKVQCLFPLQ